MKFFTTALLAALLAVPTHAELTISTPLNPTVAATEGDEDGGCDGGCGGHEEALVAHGCGGGCDGDGEDGGEGDDSSKFSSEDDDGDCDGGCPLPESLN